MCRLCEADIRVSVYLLLETHQTYRQIGLMSSFSSFSSFSDILFLLNWLFSKARNEYQEVVSAQEVDNGPSANCTYN